MKTLKKLALGIVLITGMGLAFASCSDSYYESPENLPIPEATNPIERPGIDPY